MSRDFTRSWVAPGFFFFVCLAAAFNVAASDECVEVGVQGAKRVVECEFSFFARVPESNRGKGLEPLEGLNKVNKKKWGGAEDADWSRYCTRRAENASKNEPFSPPRSLRDA